MKLHSTLLAACASLALAATGCLVGEVDDGTNPGGQNPGGQNPGDQNPGTPGDQNPGGQDPGVNPTDNPEQLFTQSAYPAINATCGANGAGCHAVNQAPVFISADPANAYTVIKNYRDTLFPNNAANTAKLLTYGEPGSHYSTYTAEHVNAIQQWLAAEAAQPIDDQPSPLAVWSGCMDLAEFQQTGMADAWADKNAQGQGDCDACHQLGGDGFIASNVDTRVFKAISEDPGLMISYFTINEAGTEVIINRARLEKVGTQQSPHQLHGAFNLDDDAYQRLQNFYNLTKARLDAGQCLPPRF